MATLFLMYALGAGLWALVIVKHFRGLALRWRHVPIVALSILFWPVSFALYVSE